MPRDLQWARELADSPKRRVPGGNRQSGGIKAKPRKPNVFNGFRGSNPGGGYEPPTNTTVKPYSRKGFASPRYQRNHTIYHTFHVCHTLFNAIGVSFLIPHMPRSPIGVGGPPPARRHGPHGHRAVLSPRQSNGTGYP